MCTEAGITADAEYLLNDCCFFGFFLPMRPLNTRSYTEMGADILDTEHTFCFANDIKIEKRLFIADQNISILNKIDALVDCDVFIGGSAEGHLLFDVFNALIKKFPKRAELTHYTNSRISALLQEYYVLSFC